MNDRVRRLREVLDEPLLVTDPTNVFYLSAFRSSNAALLVEPGRVRLFSDFRYAEAARMVEGAEFVETRRSLFTSLAAGLEGRIMVEAAALTYASYETLAAGGIELVPTRGLVERLRAVKDDTELDAIGRATAITNEAFERLARERFTGRTERELAWRVDELFHELGADGPAFTTIVAAGANGARPHTVPGDVKVEWRQTVVVDAGAALDGYCSDCTRTFATGPLPDELRRSYEVVLEAQKAALGAVRPGAAARDVDTVARSRITEAGLGDAFGHGLGHGVGLLVHEAPRLAQESEDTLEAGNVVTVEPGVYLSGLGGIRIEDLVVVRDGEPEVLTTFDKSLLTVD